MSLENNTQKQSRGWMITLNNPKVDVETHFKEVFGSDASFAIWQHEKGENGTPHIQGYVYFKKPQRFNKVKSYVPEAHIEPRHGNHEQAKAYCSKPETRIAGPWTFGEDLQPGKRNDLAELKKDLDEGKSLRDISSEHFSSYLRYARGITSYQILHSKPRSTKTIVTVIFGLTNVGKTTSIQKAFPDAFWLPAPNKGQSVWWDGYDQHSTVVIDEFYGWIEFSVIQRLLDAFPYKVQTKGGFVNFVASRVIFTSNEPPESWYKPESVSRARLESLYRRIEEVIHKTSYTEFDIIKNHNSNPQYGCTNNQRDFPVILNGIEYIDQHI